MTSAGSLRTPFEGALVVRLLERPPSSARLPVGVLTRSEEAAELRRLQARKAMDAAYEAELVLGLADDTPDTLDPPADQPGAKRGSGAPEPELAVVLNCGRRTAANLAQRAWVYREQLPATWAALTAGALDEARATVLADVLGLTSRALAREVEAQVLPEATQLSPAGCAPGRWHCCWSSTPTRSTSGARTPAGRPTCAPIPRRWRAWPPWPPSYPPRPTT